ncbi:RNA polymerase subunit sigma-70 [Streptomyces sp. NPDC058326]|uniref:RNA polymerase subunit sigma-70 n=1 Tax=Streptomyces sp. NPDC058326 TaxID=3346447 RepID=UPI0036E38626
MPDDTFLTGRFGAHEERLRGVALWMTGSPAEAEKALASVRADLGRDDGATAVAAWLTALVGRECVRGLRGRRPRPGQDGEPRGGGVAPAASGPGAAGVASLWLALSVALESLEADERLVHVLHDVFGVPPHETARITGGSPEEVTRLARRARERIQGAGTARTEGEAERQRTVVDRFLTAARARDARTLAAVLDPDVVARSERGPVHGAPAVAEGAAAFARFADATRPALVGGSLGAVALVAGRPVAAVAFTLRQDRIIALAITTGEERVRALDLAFPDC